MSAAAAATAEGRAVVFVTGGSRGFGKAVALSLGAQFADGVTVVLIGRAQQTLEDAANAVRKTGAKAIVRVADLGELDKITGHLDAAKEKLGDLSRFSDAYLINNAATLGDIAHTVEELDPAVVGPYMALNVSSPLIVTTWFLRTFKATAKKRVVVNISSLLAVKPFPYWGLYATAKAARDHLIASVAVEGADAGVRALNYAPGPMEGEMQTTIRAQLGDKTQRATYASMHKEGKLVKMDESAAKLVRLLKENTFTSGSHVDYYDVA